MKIDRRIRSTTDQVGARAAILHAAERIFAAKGLEGARTDEIARAARVNKALLFYYFRSKNDLFRAVVEEVLEGSHRRLMEILAEPGSERAVLLHYVDALFDNLSRRPEYVPLVHRLMLTDPKLVERLMKRYFLPRIRRLAAVIRRGCRKNEFRPVDSIQMAISVQSLSVLYFSWGPVIGRYARFAAFNPRNARKRRQEVVNLVRYGLFNHPEAP